MRRPRSLLGLAALALSLRWRAVIARGLPLALAVLALVLVVLARLGCCRPAHGPLRVATFNIENFPKSDRQEAPAFELLASLGAAAVGVQEIVDPDAFVRAAHARLGPDWRFAYASHGGGNQRVGVLFDGARLALLSQREYREVETYPGAKPLFEARFRELARGVASGARVLRVLVVHLKAGGDGARERRRQYAAMLPIVTAARESGERVVLLGDFNATNPEDRDELRELARRAELRWSSEALRCTSYWARNDGCPGQALDHVLATEPARQIAVRGACERVGCDPGAQCPIERELISDHCPVVLDLAPR